MSLDLTPNEIVGGVFLTLTICSFLSAILFAYTDKYQVSNSKIVDCIIYFLLALYFICI